MSSTESERRHLLPTQQATVHRSRWNINFACGAILLTETFERIAFYGAIGNFVMFLNSDPLKWASYNAANALFVFTGLSYTTSLFGGWLADAFLGKFKTIAIFLVVYICGYIFLPLLYPYPNINSNVTQPPKWCAGNLHNISSYGPEPWPPVYPNTTSPLTPLDPSGDLMVCDWAVYLAITIMGIGNGAVKANIAPFGADQVKHEGREMMRTFFNWFYWCVNIGALIALGAVAFIQQEISFFWGYVTPNICLVIALVIFCLGGSFYIRKPAGGSVLTNVCRILREACTRCQCKACCCRGEDPGAEQYEEDTVPSCLDRAKLRYGGSFHDNMVDDVKVLGRISCVFLALVPYWIVYFQMETTFVVQGMHMRLDFGSNKSNTEDYSTEFNLPTAWLSLFDVIFLLVLIPIMDRIVYPQLDKRGYHLTLRARIVMGMVFAVFAVCTAGGLEMYRLNIYWKGGKENVHWQKIGKTLFRAADLSILWQIPQYALIGISEVFASVAGLELAYSEAPRSMQSTIMGLFWCSQGIGSMLGSATIRAFKGVWFFGWDHGDINCRNTTCPDSLRANCDCHLDYYFFFLAGLQVLGLVIFSILAWKLGVGIGPSQRTRSMQIRGSKRPQRRQTTEAMPSLVENGPSSAEASPAHISERASSTDEYS